MRCGKARLIEIRNFEDFSIEPAGNMTFLTGKNGAGKTNIIEAIYFASVGKSFRTSNDEELIRLDKEEGTILLDFTVRGVTHEIKIKLSRNTMKKYSVMVGRYSSGMQHLKKLVFMDLWWMWIYGICRLPKEHRIS